MQKEKRSTRSLFNGGEIKGRNAEGIRSTRSLFNGGEKKEEMNRE